MADLHIVREHALGLDGARKVASLWAEQAEKEFGMECSYAPGQTCDTLRFARSGVKGALAVHTDRFELEATLGFLLSAFKEKIEQEIVKNLDTLLLAPRIATPQAY